MIIYLSVHDNDFGNAMTRFSNSLNYRIRTYKPNPKLSEIVKNKEASQELLKEAFDKMCQHDDLLEDINVNNTNPPKEESLNYLIKIIKEMFMDFLINDYGVEESTKDYLSKNFEVKVVNKFVDEWANGEDFYYVTSNDTLLVV